MKESPGNYCIQKMVVNKKSKNSRLLSCGFTSGIMQAIIFNPWDRALFLSVKFNRSFLSITNFTSPMSGAMQTLFQRALSSGLYLPLEDIFAGLVRHNSLTSQLSHPLQNFIAGTAARAISGLLLNPASRVKYHYWGKVNCHETNFWATTREIYKSGGISPFFSGSSATMSRDFVFGGIYTSLRYVLSEHLESRRHTDTLPYWVHGLANFTAASVATVFSSPLNYVRNVQYSSAPSDPHRSAGRVLADLWRDSQRLPGGRLQRWRFLQQQLRLGWGTARVGLGMAFGWQVYAWCGN